MTPLSGLASYCSPQEMLLRFDNRLIAQLVSDTNTQSDRGSLQTNAVLLALLQEASGDVEAASIVAQRYSPDDLAALTGNSLQKLKGLVAALAMQKLLDRRAQPDLQDLPACKRALEHLQQLRNGERIFGRLENAQAGKVSSRTNPNLPYENILTNRGSRLFGELVDRTGNEWGW